MKTLLISPHLDDAVLSAGQFMAGKKLKCDVLTVYSEVPMTDPDAAGNPYLTPYDKSCGFNSSKDAMVVRREEDQQALAILGAGNKYLHLMDSQYEGGSSPDDVVNALKDFKKKHGSEYDMILAPLGLKHPDHVTVCKAAIRVFQNDNLYLWEDLPHRVVIPEEVPKRLSTIATGPKLTFIGDGPMADKIRALWCYKSQVAKGDLDPYVLYVPERFWKV